MINYSPFIFGWPIARLIFPQIMTKMVNSIMNTIYNLIGTIYVHNGFRLTNEETCFCVQWRHNNLSSKYNPQESREVVLLESLSRYWTTLRMLRKRRPLFAEPNLHPVVLDKWIYDVNSGIRTTLQHVFSRYIVE